VKPAPEDPEHRRPVWQALSDLFLDTDTSISRSWRVGILSASPYSIDELQEILLDEVYPGLPLQLLLDRRRVGIFRPGVVGEQDPPPTPLAFPPVGVAPNQRRHCAAKRGER